MPGKHPEVRKFPTYIAYEDVNECSETSAHRILTPGKHPKVRIQQAITYYYFQFFLYSFN